jgi:hypothetical protein
MFKGKQKIPSRPKNSERITRRNERLREAMNYCDREGKSTEFMIQYMQDHARVTHDIVIEYLARLGRP